MVSKITSFDYLNASKKDYQEFAKKFYQITAKKDHLDLVVNFCDDDEMENINVINNMDNTIKLEQDGIYELNYSLNISANKEAIITSMIRQNGVMIPETVIAKNVEVGKITSFNITTIVKLYADDTLDIELSATVDNVTVTFGSGITASFSLKKIDEID